INPRVRRDVDVAGQTEVVKRAAVVNVCPAGENQVVHGDGAGAAAAFVVKVAVGTDRQRSALESVTAAAGGRPQNVRARRIGIAVGGRLTVRPVQGAVE